MYSVLLKRKEAHDEPIFCCTWAKSNVVSKKTSNDYIVTGGLDSLIKIWVFNNNKLELFRILRQHIMTVISVAVSPNGLKLASTSFDSRLILWNFPKGSKMYEIKTYPTDTWNVVFSPDSTQLAIANPNGKINIHRVRKGTMVRVLETGKKHALCLAWSPDGKYIASGAVDGSVCIMDPVQGKLLHTINAHYKTVWSISFSPNSELIATASFDTNVKILHVATAKELHTQQHMSWTQGACFSPDGTRVATCASNGLVQIFLTDGLKLLHTFHAHGDSVGGIQFNAEGDKLLSCSKDKNIVIYGCPLPSKEAE